MARRQMTVPGRKSMKEPCQAGPFARQRRTGRTGRLPDSHWAGGMMSRASVGKDWNAARELDSASQPAPSGGRRPAATCETHEGAGSGTEMSPYPRGAAARKGERRRHDVVVARRHGGERLRGLGRPLHGGCSQAP
jgi:hypothetical protein